MTREEVPTMAFPEAAELAARLAGLRLCLVPAQAAAGRALASFREAAPGNPAAGISGGRGRALYEAGPPRVLWLLLPETPPRLGVHWTSWPGGGAYVEIRDDWRNLVRGVLEGARREGLALPDRPFGHCAAFFTFYFASRRPRDLDNYSVRPVLNALRHLGVLGDAEPVVVVRGLPDAPERTEAVLIEDAELPFAALPPAWPCSR